MCWVSVMDVELDVGDDEDARCGGEDEDSGGSNDDGSNPDLVE